MAPNTVLRSRIKFFEARLQVGPTFLQAATQDFVGPAFELRSWFHMLIIAKIVCHCERSARNDKRFLRSRYFKSIDFTGFPLSLMPRAAAVLASCEIVLRVGSSLALFISCSSKADTLRFFISSLLRPN